MRIHRVYDILIFLFILFLFKFISFIVVIIIFLTVIILHLPLYPIHYHQCGRAAEMDPNTTGSALFCLETIPFLVTFAAFLEHAFAGVTLAK